MEGKALKKISGVLFIGSWLSLLVPYIFALFAKRPDNAIFLVLFFQMLFIPLFFLFLCLAGAVIWFAVLFLKEPLREADFTLAVSPFAPGILLTALISLITMRGLPDTFSLNHVFTSLWPHTLLIGFIGSIFGIWGAVMVAQQIFLEGEGEDSAFKVLALNLKLQFLVILTGFVFVNL